MSEGLPLLCVRINQARQLTQQLRGHGLKPEVADAVMVRLKECARLLRGSTVPTVQTGTRRYKLWRCSPLCLWCGRVTRIEGVYEDDAATLDHLRRKSQRARPSSLPDTVLACRRCNNERGQPGAKESDSCPVILAERRILKG